MMRMLTMPDADTTTNGFQHHPTPPQNERDASEKPPDDDSGLIEVDSTHYHKLQHYPCYQYNSVVSNNSSDTKQLYAKSSIAEKAWELCNNNGSNSFQNNEMIRNDHSTSNTFDDDILNEIFNDDNKSSPKNYQNNHNNEVTSDHIGADNLITSDPSYPPPDFPTPSITPTSADDDNHLSSFHHMNGFSFDDSTLPSPTTMKTNSEDTDSASEGVDSLSGTSRCGGPHFDVNNQVYSRYGICYF